MVPDSAPADVPASLRARADAAPLQQQHRETDQAMVADQGTDGHSAGLLKDSRDQIGGSHAGRHCRTANELRGGDPLALRPTLASRLLRVLDRSRSAIIGSASTGALAVSSGHLANLLGERPWRLRPIHRPRISDLGSPAFRPFCARRSDRPNGTNLGANLYCDWSCDYCLATVSKINVICPSLYFGLEKGIFGYMIVCSVERALRKRP